MALSSNFLVGLMSFECICLIAGVLGNLSVIVYNVSVLHTKTPQSYLVANLALTDFLTCCTVYPLWIVVYAQMVLGSERHLNDKIVCQIGVTLAYVSVFLSMLTLLALTVDKFIFINKPLKYRKIVTWPRVYCTMFMIWFTVMGFVPISTISVGVGEALPHCLTNRYVHVIGVVIFVCIPLAIILVLNVKIFKIADQQRRKILSNSIKSEDVFSRQRSWKNLFCLRRTMKEFKAVKTFAIVTGVLIGCTIPYASFKVVESFTYKAPYSVAVILGYLVVFNSVLNPVIYSIRQREYRAAFCRFFVSTFKK